MMRLLNWINSNKWLVIILLISAVLRIYHADFQSLWLDEILTMNNSNPNLTMMQFYNGIMFWEFIPHLYFFLVRMVFELFGYTTIAARVFSAVIGVFGVYAIYLFAKELFNKKAGLIAAALLGVNFFHISYSQEIRPYGMLFLFTVLAFYRLAIFIKNPTVKNAIYYGLFAGLILNSHFFGFITLFSQYVILLFFIVIAPKESRKKLFTFSFISGIVTLIVFSPAIEAFIRVSEINSFWLQKPGSEAFTVMFKEYFGNSEMVLFFIQFILIFYVVNLFKEKITDFKLETIKNNKLTFSFILLFPWLFFSVFIPLLRSYLDVPMILSRYFINILPVFILVITTGIICIKNRLLKVILPLCLIVFSLTDLMVVKNYFNTATKTQFRELTNEIKQKNTDKVKVVAYWSWLFPYFFADEPQIAIEGKSLEDYVAGLKSGSIAPQSFWYADANSRTFNLTPEDQAYLDQHFYLKEKLVYIDAWANYYVSKSETKINLSDNLDLKIFKPVNFDGNGNMLFFENTNARSELISLEKGNYELVISGNSLPATPIKGENAHLKIKINGNEIAEFNLSEEVNKKDNNLAFSVSDNEKIRIQLIYDNDIFEDKKDRNVIIYSIKIQKKSPKKV